MQVLFILPSIAMVIFAIPLSSDAVARMLILPFVGTVDPSVGVVIVTTGGIVSFGFGVGLEPGVGDGVGVGVGFKTRFKFVAVSWKTD